MLEERIKNLSVTDSCRIPLHRGYTTEVTCLRRPETKAKFFIVSIYKREETLTDIHLEYLYSHVFDSSEDTINWFRRMRTR